jgi:hypothetical protein
MRAVNHSTDFWDDEEFDGEVQSISETIDFLASDCDERGDVGTPTLMFSTSSPDGTICVTASFSGRIRYIQLAASVVRKSEAELMEEILVLGRLAQRRALAGQHAIIEELLVRRGHDRVGISSWLEHTLRLPSPRTMQQEAVAVFARIAGNRE